MATLMGVHWDSCKVTWVGQTIMGSLVGMVHKEMPNNSIVHFDPFQMFVWLLGSLWGLKTGTAGCFVHERTESVRSKARFGILMVDLGGEGTHTMQCTPWGTLYGGAHQGGERFKALSQIQAGLGGWRPWGVGLGGAWGWCASFPPLTHTLAFLGRG